MLHCTIKVKNLCAPHNKHPRCLAGMLPDRPKPFPDLQEKFPVFVFRELAPYPLIYMWKSRDWARMLRQNWRISLYFPIEQGMGVRDGFADDCPHRQSKIFFSSFARPKVRRTVSTGSRQQRFANQRRTNCSPNFCNWHQAALNRQTEDVCFRI
jgi:hypothetical protein